MQNVSLRKSTRLREFLDGRGIRYSWVAERLGCTPSHMTRLLDGTRPVTQENAFTLSQVFNVPASTFLESEAD